MKRILSALLALAMVAALAPVAFAAVDHDFLQQYHVYIKDEDDDDYFSQRVTTLAPGETGWIFLGNYIRGDDIQGEAPRSISIEEVEVWDDEEGEDVKLLSVSSKAERKRIDDDNYGWFAKLKVKSVKASAYPEDGYPVNKLVIEYTWDQDYENNAVELREIAYEEGDYELEDITMMYSFDKDDDVEIDLPDDGGVFTGIARKDFDLLASMNTRVNSSLLNKYPNADMRFFNGSGANFPVYNGRLILTADAGDHCYEVNSDNELVDISDTYSSASGGFVIKTTTLGSYVVSDTRLSGSVPVNNTAPTINEYIGTTPVTTTPSGSVVLVNPATGACL